MKLLNRLLKQNAKVDLDKLTSPSQKTGNAFERKAETFLIECGLTTVTTNFRCKLGEIDIIMLDGETLVFIEVRYRQQRSFGNALASVTWHKQKRIIRTAKYYLTQQRKYDYYPCRFDVVAFDDKQFEWVKGAFQSE